MTYFLAVALVVLALSVVWAADRMHRRDVMHAAAMHVRDLATIKVLQDANLALTESLVRAEGKPINLKPNKPVDVAVPGWFSKKHESDPIKKVEGK
jgi:hypothetical protein